MSKTPKIEGLIVENQVLVAKVSELTRQNNIAQAQIATLLGEIETLQGENITLTSNNDTLARRISLLEKRLGTDSSNSSNPPSSDPIGKKKKAENLNRAKRRAMGRKPGKQIGSEGKHLAQVFNPDEVIVHTPLCCKNCGSDLCDALVLDTEIRQVFDVPEPKMIVSEHRAETRKCKCGSSTKAEFPREARSYTSYGPRLRAVALYLLARQHLPFERSAEAIFDLFHVEVSTGWLDSLYSEGRNLTETFLIEVLDQLKASEVVHVDETTDKVKNDTIWFHVACTELLTLLHADVTRGKDGVERLGLFPEYSGVAVHDRLGLYFSYGNATHATCGAHLLRNLASVAVIHDQNEWATLMTALLLEMKRRADETRTSGKKKMNKTILADYLSRYDDIVSQALEANLAPKYGSKRDSLEKESYNLAVAFRDRKAEVTRFAADLRVGFTNNQAERDLRMLKLHSKISSCFKSQEGANRLGAVRSYISTAMKHSLDPLEVLVSLFKGNPWMPPRPQRV